MKKNFFNFWKKTIFEKKNNWYPKWVNSKAHSFATIHLNTFFIRLFYSLYFLLSALWQFFFSCTFLCLIFPLINTCLQTILIKKMAWILKYCGCKVDFRSLEIWEFRNRCSWIFLIPSQHCASSAWIIPVCHFGPMLFPINPYLLLLTFVFRIFVLLFKFFP